MLELIEHGHMPEHGLHWGYQYLDPNEEEVAAYWKKVRVFDSIGVYESSDVYNSSLISHSKKVRNSEGIYYSVEVEGSKHINNSEYIIDSEKVGLSNYITNSKRVIKSKNITDSDNIYNSTYVISSTDIYQSEDIVNSKIIWNSNSLTQCGFCYNCSNLSNALFCEGKSDGEYLLFNRPIDKIRFEVIMKQFLRFNIGLNITADWSDNYNTFPSENYDFLIRYQQLDNSFWNWIKTLPGYDASILYAMTYKQDLLEEILNKK